VILSLSLSLSLSLFFQVFQILLLFYINKTIEAMESEDSASYTIIRVKRKLTTAENDSISTTSDRFQSFKRLRHIGSFVSAPTEEQLTKSNLLKQMGVISPTTTTESTSNISNKKRLRFSDLNPEQFRAYVEKLDEDDGETKKRVKCDDSANEENNNIFNIALTDADLASPKDDLKQKGFVFIFHFNFFIKSFIFLLENEQIVCNGQVLEEVPSGKADSYIYDYYVLMDNLIDFEERSPLEEETVDDTALDDENDENYRYNDYPDEDEFGDEESEENSSDYGDKDEERDEYRFKQFDEEDEYYEQDDDDDFCDEFTKKMNLRKMLSKNAQQSDSEDSDSDF